MTMTGPRRTRHCEWHWYVGTRDAVTAPRHTRHPDPLPRSATAGNTNSNSDGVISVVDLERNTIRKRKRGRDEHDHEGPERDTTHQDPVEQRKCDEKSK